MSSTDPDGTIASYEWAEDGMAFATGDTPTLALPVGTPIITLTVTDDAGSIDTDAVTITITTLHPCYMCRCF